MSDHDPMCRRSKITEVFMEGCPECQLIARVREDERGTDRAGWYKTGWDDGYAACKDDAAKAVMALLTIDSYGTGVGPLRDDAVATILSLGGKPDPGIDERQAYALAEAYKNGREQGQQDEREAANLRWQAAMDEYGEKCQEIERVRIRTGVTGLADWPYSEVDEKGYCVDRRAVSLDEVLAVIDGGES